jgi:hypothetical protein
VIFYVPYAKLSISQNMQTTSARNVMRVYALSIDDAEDKIQLTNFSFDNEFIDMTVLTDSLTHDLLLQGIADVEKCMQSVYIMSGCDFVSFFRG